MVLRQRANRSTAEVGAGAFAAVAGKRRVQDPQPSAAIEDRAAATAVVALPGRVPVDEAHVLDRELRARLVLAVRRRPHLLWIARVHVEDAPSSPAAEGDEPAAVKHDPRRRVAHPRRLGHADRHRTRSAGKADHPTGADGGDDRARGAARGRSVTDHAARGRATVGAAPSNDATETQPARNARSIGTA